MSICSLVAMCHSAKIPQVVVKGARFCPAPGVFPGSSPWSGEIPSNSTNQNPETLVADSHRFQEIQSPVAQGGIFREIQILLGKFVGIPKIQVLFGKVDWIPKMQNGLGRIVEIPKIQNPVRKRHKFQRIQRVARESDRVLRLQSPVTRDRTFQRTQRLVRRTMQTKEALHNPTMSRPITQVKKSANQRRKRRRNRKALSTSCPTRSSAWTTRAKAGSAGLARWKSQL
jgi:hypothetical protein